ncbi:hypothetical protein BX666DRAFT_1903406 [Dichotomocladium elegans]|nr:hypothetical protein BX666DRAFT_1903406 [Dichotomocladium elegans]
MKIKKTPSKKLAPVPQPLYDVIKSLEHDPENQIPETAAKLTNWPYPRGDLFHWVQVLNRFDSILQRIVEEYDLQHIQSREFESGTKSLLLAIADVSRTLFEYCTNRNIYNSYEHMNALINTTDIDVLVSILRFMLRPAQRTNNPRAVRSAFVIPQEKITELARRWGIHADFVDIYKDDFVVTEDMTRMQLRFYRTYSANIGNSSNSSNSSTSASGGDNNVDDHTEGMHAVVAQLSSEKGKSDVELFQELVKQHDIPEEYHFELANHIRIANHITKPESRRKLLLIRVLAIAIMGRVPRLRKSD